jgi:hypothetical protein
MPAEEKGGALEKKIPSTVANMMRHSLKVQEAVQYCTNVVVEPSQLCVEHRRVCL